MEYRPSRPSQTDREPSQLPAQQQPTMSTLTMAPAPHPAFRNDYSWNRAQSPDYAQAHPEPKNNIALPSIRQAFPDLLQLGAPSVGAPGPTPSAKASPNTNASGTSTSPEYVHEPNANKRRRMSVDDDLEATRARQVPRLYLSPEKAQQRHISPTRLPRPAPAESWTPTRASPHTPSAGMPTPVEVNDRAEYRLSLPSLPPLTSMERETVAPAPMHHAGEAHAEGYQRPHHAVAHPPRAPIVEAPPPAYHNPSYGYGYQQQSRYPTIATASTRPYDRSPFTAGAYNQQYHQDLARYGDVGGLGGDSKQRKRRGNLPKETTDKLRAWFVAHLQHPYPTEDEKQELMRQTGLQMNQISNWFINARRRQLPAMINNAQAEHDAMNSRGTEGKVLATTERGDYGHLEKRATLPLSDGEGGSYDEDLESLKQREAASMNRGSI